MAERKGAKIPFPSILIYFISKAAQTKGFYFHWKIAKNVLYVFYILILYYKAKILHRGCPVYPFFMYRTPVPPL